MDGANTTLMAFLSLQEMGEALVWHGATDAAIFEAYIQQVLAPGLQRGQIVMMDNLSSHQGERVRKAIEARGCQLRRGIPMSVRLQGQLLLAGAIGAILASLLTILVPGPDGINGPNSLLANVVGVLSGLLLLVSLPVLSRAQAKQIGMLGLIGVVLLCIAAVANLLVLTGVQIVDVARPGVIPHPGGDGPPPAAVIPAVVGVFALLIGGVSVGITMLRARVFARAIGWAIIITSVLLLPLNLIDTNGTLGNILTSVGFVLFYASLAWAGAVLISRSNLTQVSESSVQRR